MMSSLVHGMSAITCNYQSRGVNLLKELFIQVVGNRFSSMNSNLLVCIHISPRTEEVMTIDKASMQKFV
jgi:hypothetical protein